MLAATLGFLPLGFVLGMIGSVPVAGPVSAMVMHRAMAGRYREGIMVAAGAAMMESLYCAMVLSGHDAILGRWPRIETSLRMTGSLVMVLLGVYFVFFLRLKPFHDTGNAPARDQGMKRHFTLGVSLVAINPAVPVNWSAIVTVVHTVGLGLVGLARGVAFVIGVGAGVLGWFGAVVFMLRHMGSKFSLRFFQSLLRALGFVLMAAGMVAFTTVII